MRVVIAGGSGYIGRELVRSFLSEGAEVLVLSRNPGPGTAGAPSIQWDGRSPGRWHEAVDGAELLINLAGERVAGPSPRYRWSADRKRLLAASRAEAGRALVAAVEAATHRPRLLIQASGIDYYAPGEVVADESTLQGVGFLSRLVAEEWEPSTAPVELLGTRRLVLRLAPLLGPGSPVLGPLLLQHRLFAGGPLGHGQQWFPWIALEDLIGALRFLAAKETASGAYNLVAPGIVRNAELSRILGALLGRPSWLPAPAFALRLAFGEMADTLLEGVRAEPARLLAEGYQFRRPDLPSALRASLATRS